MNRVLVLSSTKKPLMPCHPARARMLLKRGRAAVYRIQPFTIILNDRDDGYTQEVSVKLDPGSKVTGIAVVAEFKKKGPTVIWAAELTHRGVLIKKALFGRAGHRRFRRSRLRYREPRFLNRTGRKGLLPPSLQHRVDTIFTWVKRLLLWAPTTAIGMELVKFDLQQMENPEISGAEYQRGELAGFEVKEYLLNKWNRTCAYCGAQNVPLTIDHIHPRAEGGSDKVSNLTLACVPCNQRKGAMDVSKFLRSDPIRLARIEAQRRAPLRDAAAVNSTRWALKRKLEEIGLPLELGSGGRTKYNRTRQGYEKAHWADAACVGESGAHVRLNSCSKPLLVKAMGHGERQRARLNAHGFPRGHKPQRRSFMDFRTGDLARCNKPGVPEFVGRVAIRFKPQFSIKKGPETVQVHPRYLRVVQKGDGYVYK